MTSTPAITLGLLLVLPPAGLAAQQELKGRVFTDPVEGLRISIPRDWEQLPLNVDERKIRGWFQSEARFYGDAHKGDTGKSSHAIMRILRLQKPKQGAWRRDYRHWLAATLRKGTYKVEKKSGTAGDTIPVVRWEVEVAGPELDRERIVAWVFSASEQDYAVEFRFLEEHARPLRAAALRALETFRFVPKTVAPPRPGARVKPFVLNDWLQLPILERHRRRAQQEAAHVDKMLARVPKGWAVRQHEDFLLISHVDAKSTRHVFNTIAAFRKWLGDRFGKLSDEYAMKFTVRICKNSAESRAYRAGGWRPRHDFNHREIVMTAGYSGTKMTEVLWAVFRRYMMDVAPEVYFNMPTWLWHGLNGLIGRARLKGRKIIFPASAEEVLVYDRLRRSKKLRVWTAAELMNHPTFGYIPDKAKADADLATQALELLRFFEGPGKRCKALRGGDFLVDYMRGVRQLVREFDADDEGVLVWDSDETIAARLQARAAATSAKKPAPVPGLQDRWSAYHSLVRKRRPKFLRELHQRVCEWSAAEWAAVERSYAAFCRGQSR